MISSLRRSLPIALLACSLTGISLATLEGAPSPIAIPQGEPEQDVLVNNRILAQPVGKTITMMDVIRRLDLFFYRIYPEHANIPEARYQFYVSSWRQVLDDMINSELILADAEEKKIPIHDGDIRQELERQFGPNVVETIDQVGLTYDKAWEMTRADFIVRQMTGYMVSAKAIAKVGPGRIHQAYMDWVREQGNTGRWSYRVLSIRGRDPAGGEKAAELAYGALQNDGLTLEEVHDLLVRRRDEGELASGLSIQLSESFTRTCSEMGAAHLDVVTGFQEPGFSEPIAQKSRMDNSVVYRLFQIENFEDPGVAPFAEMEEEIRAKLISQEIEVLEEQYISRLRKRYGVNSDELSRAIPRDYYPISLR